MIYRLSTSPAGVRPHREQLAGRGVFVLPGPPRPIVLAKKIKQKKKQIGGVKEIPQIEIDL